MQRPKDQLDPNHQYAVEGFIFAYQDVRGKYKSEGEFVVMKPYIPSKKSARDTDESSDTYDNEIPTWNQYMEHGNYDEYWQEQEVLQHLDNIKHPVLNVAGWFDAEDFYSPMSIYYTLEKLLIDFEEENR